MVQAESNQACLKLLRLRPSSAKIIILFEYSQFLRRKMCSFLYFNRQVTLPILSYIFPIVSVSVPLMDSCKILISVHGSRYAQDSCRELECQQHSIDDAASNGDTVYALFTCWFFAKKSIHQCWGIQCCGHKCSNYCWDRASLTRNSGWNLLAHKRAEQHYWRAIWMPKKNTYIMANVKWVKC